MIRVAVVDDERYAREGLRQLLRSFADIEIVAEAASGREALALADTERPDALFLDVRMPGLDGFDVVDDWPGRLPVVIFVTAYDEYAVKAFEAQALDYLLKPVDDARLAAAVERLRAVMHERAEQAERLERLLLEDRAGSPDRECLRRVSIRSHLGEELLDLQEVDWIEAQNYYAAFHAGDRTLLAKIPLKRLERELNPDRFVRIHRSTIVAIDFIVRLETDDPGEWFAVLKDGNRRRVSRSGKRLLEAKVTSLR